jgi:carboxylesterase type B
MTFAIVGDAGGAGSEDCLKLNIYAPAGAKSGSKCKSISLTIDRCLLTITVPVLFYMHGGGEYTRVSRLPNNPYTMFLRDRLRVWQPT